MNAISICNTSIRQFQGLYSINDLHSASGGEQRHKPANWLANKQTVDFISEIEIAEIPAILKKQGLGTFVCKELVIHYAMWISPSFSLQVIRCFLDTVSGSLQPKTTVDERTGLRQAVSALVGRCGIDYSSAYNMIHQRFGVAAIEDIPADVLPDAVQYVHTLTLRGALDGEVLEKQPAPSSPALDDALLLAFARLLLHAQDMRLFVNRYLPAFQNLGIDGRGSLWSFVHDTEPTFAEVRRFMTAQSVKSNFFARDWAWVQSRILSTAKAF
ncbi:hypothetical protein HpSP79_12340 [Helicobacter pylori]